MNLSDSGEAVEEKKRLYEFIFFSVYITPIAAAVVITGPLFVFGVIITFCYLALYVLPVAFGGLAIGYFASRWSNTTKLKRFRNAALGYLAGFVIGLNIVSLYSLATSQSTLLRQWMLIGYFGGLIIAFLISKVGKSRSNYYYSYWTDMCASMECEDRNLFRRNVTLILVELCALTIVLPFIASG